MLSQIDGLVRFATQMVPSHLPTYGNIEGFQSHRIHSMTLTERTMKPLTLLKVAHISMAITFLLSVIILVIIYGMELPLGIPLLIFLHILFVVMAAIFKISYVLRLNALKQLGKQAH
jgi:hypothetical protein